jgi:hypothetical protein
MEQQINERWLQFAFLNAKGKQNAEATILDQNRRCQALIEGKKVTIDFAALSMMLGLS